MKDILSKKVLPRFSVKNKDQEKDCFFLGLFHSCDLYFCRKGGFRDSVMALFGPNDTDSVCSCCSSNDNPLLEEAIRRAINLGFISDRLGD